MGHHVTGIFSDAHAAEGAVRRLAEGRFNPDEISILVADREGQHEELVEHDTGVAEGAIGGAAVGAILGGLGAVLISTGLVVAPGLSLFATGPLLAGLQGAAGGAGVGFGFGAVGGLGFWKDEAHIHANSLEAGGIVVAVPAEHEHADEARAVFEEEGADHVRG